MSANQQFSSTILLALIVALPGIVAAIAAAYNLIATKRVQEGLKEVKLTVDPLTGVLDGQLEAIKKTIAEAANLQGRSDLLAEQAIIAAAVASATLPQVMANLPAPIPVQVIAEKPVPVTVTQGENS